MFFSASRAKCPVVVRIVPLLVIPALVGLTPSPASAATFTPATPAELVAAINTANTNAATDVIDLGGNTFTLTAAAAPDSGLPIIADDGDNDLTIQNGTIERSSAGGTPQFRILTISAGDVTLNDLTLANGSVATSSGGGGAVANNGSGTLTLTNTTVQGSSADTGGGIFSIGPVALIETTVQGNVAGVDGGGIYADGPLTMDGSRVEDNSAAVDGGGVHGESATAIINSTFRANAATSANGVAGALSVFDGSLRLTNSTVSGNSAGAGAGGIRAEASTVTIANSTVSGNAADSDGGGIYVKSASAAIVSSTIAFNSASTPGANVLVAGSNVAIEIESTIIAAPQGGGANCTADVTVGSFNLISEESCGLVDGVNSNQVGTTGTPLDPKLGPLANNGGPTQTHALLTGSPAIDTGDNPLAFEFDQRGTGFPRVEGAQADVGAFEASAANDGANLSVTKSGPSTASVGENFTYTVTVSNGGPATATNVKAIDTLPPGVSFVSAAPSQGSFDPGSGLWSIGTLVNTASATLPITVTAAVAGTAKNVVTVDSDQADSDQSDNDDSVYTSIGAPGANLSVRKSGPSTASVGENFTYTVTVSNGGPATATNVKAIDTLPPGVSFVSAAPSQGSFDPGSGLWSIGTLVNTASATLPITVTAAVAGTAKNVVTVDSDQADSDRSDNDDSVYTSIGPPSADLSITKTDGVTSVTGGGATTYLVTASNAGPSPANGATVADVLPAGLTGATWSSTSAGGATGNETSGTGNISDAVNLPAGASVTYLVATNVASSATGSIVNTATVTAPGGVTDSVGTNNSATDTDAVNDVCAPSTSDCDGDGLTKAQEFAGPGLCGTTPTDPEKKDSDGDGLSDGAEAKGITLTQKVHYGTKVPKVFEAIGLVKPNACKADTDGDKLSDGAEVKGIVINQKVYRPKKYGSYTITTRRTNPLLRDTDKDGASDRQEVTGSLNVRHHNHRSDPTNADTDWGGAKDGSELTRGTDPTVAGE